jgi:hypothetical protein
MGLSGDMGKQKALLLVECLQLTVTDWPTCGPYTVPQCMMFNMKKGENGWLQQEEDGESQNTFSWTGWMTERMDG